MKPFSKRLLLFLLIAGFVNFGMAEAQSRTAQKVEAKAEKQKEKQKRAYLLSQKKDKKRRFDMQTSETKKRIKDTKKDAKKINDQNHQSFLKKLFHRKKKK